MQIGRNSQDPQATWNFRGLQNGSYIVLATWQPHGAFATNAPFTVTAGSRSNTIYMNQQIAPSRNIDRVQWEALGEYNVTNGNLTVTLTTEGIDNGFVAADAIRLLSTGQTQQSAASSASSSAASETWQECGQGMCNKGGGNRCYQQSIDCYQGNPIPTGDTCGTANCHGVCFRCPDTVSSASSSARSSAQSSGPANTATLHSVVRDGSTTVITYSKDMGPNYACFHLFRANGGKIRFIQNVLCRNGSNISVTIHGNQFPDGMPEVGQSVKICEGNRNTPCSNNITVTGDGDDEIVCTDTDATDEYPNGVGNYWLKGTVRGPGGGGGVYTATDRCIDDTRLMEHQCINGGTNTTNYNCQYGCEDGACQEGPGEAELSLSTPDVQPNPVLVGDTVKIGHIVANAGPDQPTNMKLETNIPHGLSFSPSDSHGSCARQSNQVVCTNPPMSQSFNISFFVPPGLSCGQSLSYSAVLSADQDDPIAGNNSRTAEIEIDCTTPVLSLSNPDIQPNPVEPGSDVTITHTISQEGLGQARNVLVQTNIPSGMSFNASASSNSCREENSLVLCESPAVGQPFDIVFDVVQVSSCDRTEQYAARLTATDIEPITKIGQIEIECPSPELSLSEPIIQPNPVQAGDDVTISHTITKAGQFNPDYMFVEASTPDGMTFNAQASHSSCQEGPNHEVICNDPPIDQSFNIVFGVNQDAPCDRSSFYQIQLSAQNNDHVLREAHIEIECTQVSIDLSLNNATVYPNPVTKGESFIISQRVSHRSQTQPTNTRVEIPIPQHLAFNQSESDASCRQVGNKVVCSDFSFSCSGGGGGGMGGIGMADETPESKLTEKVFLADLLASFSFGSSSSWGYGSSGGGSIGSSWGYGSSGGGSYGSSRMSSASSAFNSQGWESCSNGGICSRVINGGSCTTQYIDCTGAGGGYVQPIPTGDYCGVPGCSAGCFRCPNTVSSASSTYSSGQSSNFTCMEYSKQLNVSFVVQGTATCDTTIDATASVSADEVDPTPSNDTSLSHVEIECNSTDLSVSEPSISPMQILPNGTSTFRWIVTNEGSADATSVELAVSIPQGVTTFGGDQRCQPQSADIVVCSQNRLNRNQETEFTVGFRFPNVIPASRGFTATVSAEGTDPQPANNVWTGTIQTAYIIQTQ